jgi:ABC-type thiamin/hydroxymethylpyrimidine transport system permease subunit
MLTFLALLFFDAVATLAAITPGMALPEPGSTVMHLIVAAVNVVLLARIFGALCPAIYITFALGISCEVVQLFCAGRSASFGDILADCAGILLALGALTLFPATEGSAGLDAAPVSDEMHLLCREDLSA